MSIDELTVDDDARPAPREFSLHGGGPFQRLLRRVHALRADGLLNPWPLVAFAWLPLMAGGVVRAIAGAPSEPLVLDVSVHVRFLIALPLVVLSSRLLEAQCRAAVVQLCDFAERRALDRIVDRAERLRDSRGIELVLALAALAAGQLVFWGATRPAGVFSGAELMTESGIRVWYGMIALPLLYFLGLRWVWRWAVWTYLLARVSRLPLAATATHPDGAAGLGFLAGPVTGFAAFALGVGSVLAAAWGAQLLAGRVTVPALLPTWIAFLVIAVLVACGPLLLFTRHLFWAQRRALLAYGPFSLDYVRRFHGKWIEHRDNADVLGTPDIQSLADLGTAYQSIQNTGMFVFGTRKLVELWLAAIVPMLPLVATVVPIEHVLRRLGSALFGGIPL